MIPSNYQKDFYDTISNTSFNVVLEAKAGSGKSTTIENAIKFIPSSESILFLAFNVHIVKELKNRIKDSSAVISTIHGMGSKLLSKTYNSVLDKYKYREIAKTLSREWDIDQSKKQEYINRILKLESLMRLDLCDTIDGATAIAKMHEISTIGDEVKNAIQLVQTGRKMTSKIDYTDMLYLPNYYNLLPWRYRNVFVDECQDMSKASRALMLRHVDKNGRFFAVGDPNQCQPSGTKVLMADKTEKPIEDIRIGDYIISYNIECDDFVIRRIQNVVSRLVEEDLISITSNKITSTYTSNHKTYANHDGELFELSAEYLIKGMKVGHYTDNRLTWLPIDDITHIPYKEKVYSLDVDIDHNYVADGILTHNCIYSFAGSDVNSFNALRSIPNTKTLPLSVCYRCCKSVIREAQKIVPGIEWASNAIEGCVDRKATLKNVKDGNAILCRTTMPLVKLCLDFLADGKKAFIKGKDIGTNLIKFMENSHMTKSNDLWSYFAKERLSLMKKLSAKFNLEKEEVEEHNDVIFFDEKVAILSLLSVGTTSCDQITNKIQAIFDDDSVDGILLSTVHKAKGSEFNTVYIIQPKLLPAPWAKSANEKEQERNLLYVAITRAKEYLGFVDEEEFDAYEKKKKSQKNQPKEKEIYHPNNNGKMW